jgi:hypothetical protein
MQSSGRVETIDLWRGLILAIIFVNHVPGNLFEPLSPKNYGLSDSAEAFVFISGFSVALAFFPKILAGDWLAVTRRCLKRAVQIYGVHLLITAAALALFGKAYLSTGNEELLSAHGRDLVFAEPVNGVLGLLLMSHQIGYFNILPLYVILMACAPLMLLLARVHVALALAVSIAIYAATRAFDFNLPNWPGDGVWFFDPLAWQLVFTIGMVAGIVWRRGPSPVYVSLALLSAAMLWIGFAIATEGLGLSPLLSDFMRGPLDLGKTQLGLGRLAHFLALAYMLSTLGLGAKLLATPFASSLKVMGRHGLAVFAAGSVLSAMGQILSALVDDDPMIVGAFVVAGLATLIGFAFWLDWAKTARRPAIARLAKAA